MNTLEKLAAVQAELKAPKGQFNSFGKYRYRSCEDILEAVKPILKAHGLALVLKDDVRQIGERYYVTATAAVIDPETGERVEATASAREEAEKKGMDASQITGAASSYARKYALNGLFAIDDTKDADATNDHGKGKDEAPAIVCADCGRPIRDGKKKDGSPWPAADIAAYTHSFAGRDLCVDCGKVARETGK